MKIIDKKNSYKLMKLKLIKGLLLNIVVLISLISTNCANMQTPTGGPKDSIPPIVLNELPENYLTNFDSKQINIQFDEYIKLNNYQKEFSISPDLDKQPEYKIKKKNLIITLPDSLEENTTYTINFGKGLVDFNEGNPIINYTYVFSTGPELDSLSISGNIINAYTNEFDPKEDLETKVLLIPTSQDSIFGKKKANIFTNVDSSGNFKFNNLRENTYRIYALKEDNNDRIYNNPNELIGFLTDSIILKEDINEIKLLYSAGKPNEYRTTERKILKDSRISIKFNQPLDSPTLKIIEPKILDENTFVKLSETKDSAYIYLNKIEFDSIKIEISNKNKILDTTLIRRSKNDKYNRELIPKLNVTGGKVDRIEHIKITSDYPIANIDKEKILIMEDTISKRNFQLQKDTINENLYHIRYNWRPKINYKLILKDDAIKSIFNDTNKELITDLTLDENANYGDINFTINNLDSNINYIVEVIDETKTKVFDKKYLFNENYLTYKNFPGGKYSLRIIKDDNNNNRWDGADVFNKKQAESIWYLETPFTIRANWEQSENITPQFLNIIKTN